MRIIELTEEARTNILENLLKRSPNSYGEFEGRVNEYYNVLSADEVGVEASKEFIYNKREMGCPGPPLAPA